MDSIQTENNQYIFYANTQLQPLAQHLFAVGYLATRLFEQSVDNDEYQGIKNTVFLAASFHDLGKCDPHFQTWVRKKKQINSNDDGQHINDKKFSFENHPRHNEISLLWFFLFEKYMTFLNVAQKEAMQHTVYWHHAKPYRKNDKFKSLVDIYNIFSKNLGQDNFEKFLQDTLKVLKQVSYLSEKYDDSLKIHEKFKSLSIDNLQDTLEEFCYAKKDSSFPSFKDYSQNISNVFDCTKHIQKNALHNILRACIISADRIISALTAEDLDIYIQQQRLHELSEQNIDQISSLKSHLEQMSFPDSLRTQKQNEVALELTKIENVAVLAGAAGCGKTRIALEWAKLKNAQKIFWICPRVQICQGIFTDLTTSYLPDAHIEIFTGEFKFTNSWDTPTKEESYFSADIVVTTIDQIFKAIVSHTKIDSLIPFMNSHVIFDEFHEYINMDIFNLLFAELIKNKQMRKIGEINTLLVSATPHYLYLKEMLNIKTDYDVVEMESFNPSRYKINFINYDEKKLQNNPFYAAYDNKTFIISNTAKQAQLGFIYQQKNENSILFHSKFKRGDKKQIFQDIYESFKQQGTQKYRVLRSGPIVQASLNISCNHMLSEMSSAENILQRLGRLDRFGENQNVNVMQIAITEDIQRGKQIGASAKFLAKLYQLQSAKVWSDYLMDKIGDNSFTLPEIYRIYKDFHHNESCLKLLRQDLLQAILHSIVVLSSKITEPIKIVTNKASTEIAKISKNSLRGDSRFVQAALLNIDDFSAPEFVNQYACSIPTSDHMYFDYMTESLSTIQNTGLIDFMAQKHHNIDPDSPTNGIKERQQNLRKMVLENYARDAHYPIYLSYTEDDLNRIGGMDVRYPHAMYYAICEKQSIGILSIDDLSNLNQARGE
ncbi:CRISPR-associated endonuclease Cas3'' [Gallibacterium salpingitidis]|uniref:CRISPR-associated endonuclease Cas3'' n=1 Tax=Gallibacterium salpingitidis TaxID=505341 RepID=UPI00082515AF|nr:CRISPR-associated endonuclease Cas3'' [Gallibacterium salpingitidis]